MRLMSSDSRRFATPIQLEKLAALITSTLNGDAVNALIPSGSTVRMLRRADIYELPNLQGAFLVTKLLACFIDISDSSSAEGCYRQPRISARAHLSRSNTSARASCQATQKFDVPRWR